MQCLDGMRFIANENMAFILANNCHVLRSMLIGCCCAALQMDHASLLKQFEHLDPHNQNTFEAKDLELLISTVCGSAHLCAFHLFNFKGQMLWLSG